MAERPKLEDVSRFPNSNVKHTDQGGLLIQRIGYMEYFYLLVSYTCTQPHPPPTLVRGGSATENCLVCLCTQYSATYTCKRSPIKHSI